MDRPGITGRLVAAGGSARRLHSAGVSAQQRVHLAAVLIALAAALPLRAQSTSDIRFNPNITQADFRKFSHIIGQGIYPTAVNPAGAAGLLRFEVGAAATLVDIDTNASYWRNAVGNDFSTSGYLAVPRLVASKGLGSSSVFWHGFVVSSLPASLARLATEAAVVCGLSAAALAVAIGEKK